MGKKFLVGGMKRIKNLQKESQFIDYLSKLIQQAVKKMKKAHKTNATQ